MIGALLGLIVILLCAILAVLAQISQLMTNVRTGLLSTALGVQRIATVFESGTPTDKKKAH